MVKEVWAAGVAVLASGLAHFLHYNAFPILSWPMLVGLFYFVALMGPLALLASFNRLTLIIATLPIGWLAARAHGYDLAVAFVASLLVGLATAWKGRKAPGFLAVMFGLTGLLAPLSQADAPFTQSGAALSAAPQDDRPPRIRIILDQQGPLDYSDHGYEQELGHFTAYTDTQDSVPLIAGRHIDDLEGEGFAVEVWQSDWVSICRDSCVTYAYGSLAPIADLPVSEQIPVALLNFARMIWDFGIAVEPTALTGRVALERVVERANRLQPGEALVAHVIFPHSPFVHAADCTVKAFEDWRGLASPGRKTAYEDQARCAKSLLSRLRRDADIIIESDHGNRIDSARHALRVMRKPAAVADRSQAPSVR